MGNTDVLATVEAIGPRTGMNTITRSCAINLTWLHVSALTIAANGTPKASKWRSPQKIVVSSSALGDSSLVRSIPERSTMRYRRRMKVLRRGGLSSRVLKKGKGAILRSTFWGWPVS